MHLPFQCHKQTTQLLRLACALPSSGCVDAHMRPGPQYPSPLSLSLPPSKTSTTGYTDQMVLHEIVAVRLARMKFLHRHKNKRRQEEIS